LVRKYLLVRNAKFGETKNAKPRIPNEGLMNFIALNDKGIAATA
jgi:hypothetical protein